MTRTETENYKRSSVSGVRGDYRIADVLNKLERQIVGTIDFMRASPSNFPAPLLAEALSDRELATLELWAGEDDKFIHDECERRQAEYEAFTRRFAPPGKPEPAAETTS